MPQRYAEARLRQVSGQMHLQQGERGLARTRMEVALAIVRRLASRKDVERTEHAIADLPSD